MNVSRSTAKPRSPTHASVKIASILYLDSSAILRPVLEQGFSPDVEKRIDELEFLTADRRLQAAAEAV